MNTPDDGDARNAASQGGDDDDEPEMSVTGGETPASGTAPAASPTSASAGASATALIESHVAKSTSEPPTESEAVAAAGPAAAVAEPMHDHPPARAVPSEPAHHAEVIPFPAVNANGNEKAGKKAAKGKKPSIDNSELQAILAPLVERLRAGRCVLWAGAGIDEAAGGVSFRGVVGKLLDTIAETDQNREELREARELLPKRPFLVAGFVKRRLGDGFTEALRQAAKSPTELPPELKSLGELPFRAVLTTGFSDLMSRAFTHDGQRPPEYTPRTIASRETRGRYLFKALGDVNTGEGVVFSARDFQSLLGDEALTHTVRDFYKNRTIVFVGIDTPVDVDRLFVRLLQGTPASGVEHYAVLPGLTRLEREELEESYKLKIIDEADVLSVIRALREAVGDVTEALPEDDDLEGWMNLLTAEPDRTDALEKIAALQDKLEKAGDHERLLELHLGMTEIEGGHTARASRLHQVARVFEQGFGDLAKAFTALVEAYKEDPTHENASQTTSDLERLAEATGAWAELLGEYMQVAPRLPEKTRADHWVRVARLYGEKLGHGEYALAAADEALKLAPDHKDGHALRIDALRKTEKWKDLATALGQQAAGEESAEKKAALHLEQGDLFESRLADGGAAVAAYRAARAAHPGSMEALDALELLHRRRSEWKDLVGILDEKAKTQPAHAAETRLEAASLVADKLGNRTDAITRYEAIRADQGGIDVLRALEKLYEAEGRTDAYLEVLAAQADAARDGAERTSLFRRLAAEWEDREGGRTHAASWYEKLLVADPRSEDGYRSVERLYAAEGKWEALVDAYRRHAEVQGADKLAMLVAIARTLELEIKDPHRAIDAWSAVTKLAPQNEDALSALTRLFEQTEAWDKALALLDQRAEQTKDKELKAKLLFDGGRIAADKRGDVKQAEERFHKALEVDHAHVPSMTAMVELYRKSGEFLRAAKLLVEAQAHTTNRLEKTRMLVEAGEIYDSMEQHTTATDLLLKALEVDPEHVEAGARVTELLWKAERFADLVPVLDMLTRKEADKPTMKTRWLRLGRSARTIGQNEKAGRAYMRAAELDPTDVEAQRACGELFFAEQKWTEAREAFKAVLGHGGDDLADKERVELYFRLGECDRKLGHLDKAKNFYAKALEIDATHRPTILARIDLEGDDPKKIIEAKRSLLATATGDDERVKIFTEIGEMHLDKLEDPTAAAAAFREAIAIKPESRALLHKALDVYVGQKDWPQSLEILSRLTDLEKSPLVRAKLKYTRAMVHLEELSETDAAIKLLSEATDDDPAAAKMSQKLEDLLVGAESWKELQRYYRKVIKRMAPEADSDSQETKQSRLRIWSSLADVSIDKLGEIGVGLPALEVTSSLDPQNAKRKEQLAELYVEGGPDYADKAIAAHQQLLKGQHDRIASYRALRQLYGQTRQLEKALAVAYALSFLKKGTAEDQPIVDEAKKRPLQPARRNLDEDLWTRCLAHPDEDRYLNALFTALLPTLSLANGKQHKDVGLVKKDQVQNTDPRGFAKGIRYVTGALNVTMPHEVYVKYEQREALSVANCVDAKMQPVPALVIGQPLLGDKRSEREMVFELTKRLAFFRPERYLRFLLPQAAQLGMVIDAAVGLGAEQDREKGPTGEVGKIAQDLKRALPPKVLEQVSQLGKKLKGQRGEGLAAAWLAATELTSARAAFLLVGDLEAAARLMVGEPATVSTHPTLHRLKEMVWFSITEECFTLQKHMGLMG